MRADPGELFSRVHSFQQYAGRFLVLVNDEGTHPGISHGTHLCGGHRIKPGENMDSL